MLAVGAPSLRSRPAAGIAHWLGRGSNAREAYGPDEGDDVGEVRGGTGADTKADTGADTGSDTGGGTARPDAVAVGYG